MLMGGAPGDPSLWSASKSEGAVSAWVESVVETSGGCKFDFGVTFACSNSLGILSATSAEIDVGDSMTGTGIAGGLPMGDA